MVHLLEMPLDVTGDYAIVSFLLDLEARHKVTNISKRLRVDRRAFLSVQNVHAVAKCTCPLR